MKKSPQTLQLETLLQMKQSIFLDWLNKSGLFPDLCPLTSFAQLADSRIFSYLINLFIFDDGSLKDLDYVLSQWRNYPDTPMPLFLEPISAKEIMESSDIQLLLLEFLYNLSFKNSKFPNKQTKPMKMVEKAPEALKDTLIRSLESSKLEKSFENSRKLMKSREPSRENLNISQSTIGKIPHNKEAFELSPINKRRYLEKPPEVTEPPLALKQKLLNWLISIGLLKKNIPELETKLPKICTNGVIFADLIERVHGKGSCLKGIILKPKNRSQAIANLAKVFVYFRKFEKVNPRFLFKEKELLESNPHVFWNFLDDLYYFLNNKVSPYDVRYIKPTAKTETIDKFAPPKIQQPEKSPVRQEIYQRKVTETPYETEVYLDKKDFSIKTPPKRNSYCSIHQDKKNLINEMRRPGRTRTMSFYSILTPEKSRRNSLDLASKSPTPIKLRVIVTEETKITVKAWLKELGFRGFLLEKEEKSVFLDPFRNGVLLFTVLGLLGYEMIGMINSKPGNIEEIRENWKVSWGNLKRLGFEKGFSRYFSDVDEFIRGDSAVIYEILRCIRNARDSGKVQEDPGYTEDELDSLEKTLIKWLKETLYPMEITRENFYKGIKTGVLLCEIVRRILKTEAMCFKFPRNQGESLMNINKSLEALKKIDKRKIGQKFIWKSKEILNEDRNIILGLLEDVFRYFMGIPAREGENYFADGPIGEEIWEKRKIYNGGSALRDRENNKENQGGVIIGSKKEKNEKMYSLLMGNCAQKFVLREHN